MVFGVLRAPRAVYVSSRGLSGAGCRKSMPPIRIRHVRSLRRYISEIYDGEYEIVPPSSATGIYGMARVGGTVRTRRRCRVCIWRRGLVAQATWKRHAYMTSSDGDAMADYIV